ncbi:MAG: sigma 54-interacting transcriptional regulator, partial [Deltaproteobacteria bacterium]|nr:sigma 54-interacting transcriptional regulator [Deltaproteobacteria bacterium]
VILLALVSGIATIIARSITRRVQKLTKASYEIAEGNLEKRVPILGRDEIGELGNSFNRMAESLQSQRKQLAAKEKEEKIHLKSRLDLLEKELAQKPFEGIVFESQEMKNLMSSVIETAATDATVLILGERGTGKEMVASAIHSLSNRKTRPYLRLNCAAIAESLIESEVFGHVRGSFTGAQKDKPGFFEAASGGTLLLDEISELSKNVQAKLLRVLQEKVVTRVGDTQERSVDVRLIAASNRDLNTMVQLKTFRADLYDRLHVIPIHIPPLRERKEDILPLARFFLQKAVVRHDKNILGISESAVEAMMHYSWPGNVRELENAMERAVIRAKETYIEKEDLVMNQKMDTPFSEVFLPDMPMDQIKVEYAKYIRDKYPAKPLREIKEILNIDWNTLRKYLSSN